jgi:hypothetical protein
MPARPDRGLYDRSRGLSDQVRVPPATGPTTPGGPAGEVTRPVKPPGLSVAQSVLSCFVLVPTQFAGRMPSRVSVEVLNVVFVRAPVCPCDSAAWASFLSCVPRSQEQKSGIFPRDLTTPQVLPMMVKSSARRRHGPARDVLRTNVPVAGQPSQRAGWGATARAGGGLPAAVADPVGPRAGNLANLAWCSQVGGVDDCGLPVWIRLDRVAPVCNYHF